MSRIKKKWKSKPFAKAAWKPDLRGLNLSDVEVQLSRIRRVSRFQQSQVSQHHKFGRPRL